MVSAKQHNHWKLMAMRRIIETRFSELCTFFDVEQTLARGLMRLTSTTSKKSISYYQ